MPYFVGLDVSVKKTAVCIMDETGKVIKEAKVESDPEALAMFLFDQKLEYDRVGLEAGPLSQWLYAGMAKAGLPIYCVETRHAKAFIKAQINKNDRNDARGLAHMMRTGVYVPVHVKTIESQRLRVLLTARKLIQTKMLDIEGSIRGMIRNFGMKVGPISRTGWENRIRELIEGDPLLVASIEPLLVCRRTMREQYVLLQKQILAIVRQDPTCRLLMTCPGVGPFVSLTYKTTIDIPQRFRSSKAVGAHIGLTPRQYQSGEIDVSGHISKCGDRDLRTALVEAAMSILSSVKRNFALRAWGLKLAKRSGMQKAAIAMARRLAVILHRMWIDGTEFRWAAEPQPIPALAAA